MRHWFDPSEGGRVGSRPDYRFSLANERTFLAWLRTGLALVGGGLAAAQFLPEGALRVALAVALLGLGAATSLAAVGHWARSEQAMRQGHDLPPSRFRAVLALLVGAGATALAVVFVVAALRR